GVCLHGHGELREDIREADGICGIREGEPDHHPYRNRDFHNSPLYPEPAKPALCAALGQRRSICCSLATEFLWDFLRWRMRPRIATAPQRSQNRWPNRFTRWCPSEQVADELMQFRFVHHGSPPTRGYAPRLSLRQRQTDDDREGEG